MKVIMFPGQGSQYKGMGKNLFRIYQQEALLASEILGYDLEELCLTDPKRELGKTQFTQPALYSVNAFGYYEQLKQNKKPDFLIGHSLGEYNALLAAGVFNFETGLRLVKKRGELMSAASGGGMAAVLGIDAAMLRQLLVEGDHTTIDVANYNTPLQYVISGPQSDIKKVLLSFDSKGIKIIPLAVSAPFHSRYMKAAAQEFSTFIRNFEFSSFKIPVISNVTAKPYAEDQIVELLSKQIESSVLWTDSIRYLTNIGNPAFEEIGGTILSKMVNEIKNNEETEQQENKTNKKVKEELTEKKVIEPKERERNEDVKKELSMRLGSATFRKDYGINYAYVTGSMYKGISSKELVVRVGKAGLIGFLGTAGMSLDEIESNIQSIQTKLTNGEPYGVNLLHQLDNPPFEMKTVALYLKYNITKIEAAGFMQMTEALVYFRLKGFRKDENGCIHCDHKIIAKISRPEVAELFMRPAPKQLVDMLLEKGLISAQQAQLSQAIPMSHDICVEADSGGHTDGGIALVLLPSMQQLKRTVEKEYTYEKSICIGLAGGIGTPQAIACAFVMAADFVLTGSINQCTVEAGTSDAVKDLLQEINVQDTEYAPAGDMFEIGARVQVLKRGVLFPARANKLYSLYNQFNSIAELPDKVIQQLEKNYFKKSIDEVWEETKVYKKSKQADSDLLKADGNPKYKMALIFKSYFGYSSKIAFNGDLSDKVNFQVHTGPSLGAFNQWVKGTALENWRSRHADKIGIMMMEEAAKQLTEILTTIKNN